MPIENLIIYTILVDGFTDNLLKVSLYWFQNQINQTIWYNMIVLYQKIGKITVKDLKELIQETKHKKLDQIFERIDYIYNLETIPPGSIVEDFREYFKQNKLKELNAYITNNSYTSDMKMKKTQEINDLLISENLSDKFISLQEVYNKYIEGLENDKDIKFRQRSIYLKNDKIREIFDGQIIPAPYIIAGAPGFNKTSLGINILIDIDSSNKYGLVFTWEDTIETFRNKWIAIKNDIPIKQVMNMRYSLPQKDALKKTIVNSNIYITNESFNIREWTLEVHRQMALREWDYIFIDFMQLFNYNRRFEHFEIAYIMREFVNICNKYYIPLICLSQITTKDKVTDGDYLSPTCKDLFGSGSMEQMARNVFTLGGIKDSPMRELFRRKTSYGAIGSVDLEFNQETGRLIK